MSPCRVWLGVLLGAICMAATAAVADPYSDRVQFADGLYTRQMYDLAQNEYAAVLKEWPDGAQNDAATFRMAECLRFLGKLNEAAQVYSQVVSSFKQSPFRLRAAYRRARLYMSEGDYQSAVSHFGVILQLLNNQPEADLAAATLYYLGESLLEMKQEDDAEKTLSRLVKEYESSMFSTYALMQLGDIFRKRWVDVGETDVAKTKELAGKALGFFKQALERPATDRISAEALFQVADILFRQRVYKESAEYYRQLLNRFPGDERSSAARLQAAWAASNAGLYAEAVVLAEAALKDPELISGQDEWLYLKANAERQLLQNDAAVQTYQALLNGYPESRYAESSRYEMALAYFKMGQYEKAVEQGEKVRLTRDVRADVCWLLAESYAALNKPAESIQYYRLVIKEATGTDLSRDATYRLAHQLQKRSSYREASEFYNTVVSQFPKDSLAPKALYASAYCLAEAGSHEGAIRDWRRLIEEYPQSDLVEDSFYQKAMSEVRLERREDATASLNEMIRRFPKSRFGAEAYYWKGMLLREQARYKEAEEALNIAMKSASREELRRESTFQLGLVLQKLDRGDEAAVLFQRLLSSPIVGKFPPALLEWLSVHHFEAQSYDRAAQAANLLVEAGDEPGWHQAGLVLLGRAEYAQKKMDAAETAFKKALGLEVNTLYSAEAALQLGELLLAKNNSTEADQFFRTASVKASSEKQLPVRARAFFGLGRAAELEKRFEDASRYFMSVAILYDHPDIVPESLFRAAEAFEQLGRFEDRNRVIGEMKERYQLSEWTEKAKSKWLN